MPLQLSTASDEDFPAIVRTQFAAFHPMNVHHSLIYPSSQPPSEKIIRTTVSRHIKDLRKDSSVRWMKVTDVETQTIVAASKWSIFPPPPVPTRKLAEDETSESGRERRWPDNVDTYWVPSAQTVAEENLTGNGVSDKEFVTWVMEEFFERRRKHVQGPGVLLDISFTHPEWHRKGAGKMMVEWGCREADRMGVKGWVEASRDGFKLYRSCGFFSVEEVVLDGGKVKEEWKDYDKAQYWFMIRDA